MKLIDADALRKNSKMLYSIHSFEPVDGYTQDQLDAQPTIDAVPVVHARWIEDGDTQTCSNCGKEHAWGDYNKSSYCPHCGAKMDGEKVDGG